MSETNKKNIGKIVWHDLTVPDADAIQQFYCDVVGWQSKPHNMGDYHDFDIISPGDGETVTGICYARAANANLPALWLMYVSVADVEQSAAKCIAAGGQVLDGPRMMGTSHFCIIQDPAGAVLALIS